MTKRILALFLVCILAIPPLVVPAAATTVQDIVWYNLLDYGTAVSNGNFFTVSGTREITLPVPVQTNLYYVDMVVKSTSTPAVTAIWESRSSNLIVRQISGSDNYRVYGSLPAGNYSQLKLKFTCGSTSYVTILSCYVSASDVLYYQEKASVRVVGGPVTSFTPMASVTTPATGYMASGSYAVLSDYTSYIMLPNVINYDFIDVFVDVYAYSINSLSLYVGDQLIPFEVNYLNNSSNIDSGSGSVYNTNVTFEIMIRADLCGLNRNIDPSSSAFLTIEGAYQYENSSSSVTVKRYSGFVMSNNVDPTLWYLRKIEKNFSTWFSSLQNHLTTKFNDLKTHLTTAFTDLKDHLSTKFTDLTTNLSSWFTDLKDHLSTKFNDLKTHLTTEFTDLKDHLSTKFTDLTTNLSSWFTTNFTWLERIRDLLNTLILGRHDQWNDAQDFQDDVATQETQIDDMIDIIETSPTVPIGQVESQIGQMNDVMRPASNEYYQILTVLIEGNSLLRDLIFASLIFATLGFLLYGKKG